MYLRKFEFLDPWKFLDQLTFPRNFFLFATEMKAFYVIDKSGSMGGQRMELAKRVISNSKGSYKGGFRIFAFDGGVTEVYNESSMGYKNS